MGDIEGRNQALQQNGAGITAFRGMKKSLQPPPLLNFIVRRAGQRASGVEMMSRGRAGQGARPEELASLLALAPGFPAWVTWRASIALAPDVVVRVANADWIGRVSAQADRNLTNPRKVEYSVTLTMFCKTAPRTERGRSQLRAWQRGITEQLRALGYEGEWQQRAPGGPLVNYFSKDVARLARIPPAVRKLQRVRF